MTRIQAEDATSKIYDFLHSADLDALASILSQYVENDAVVVFDSNGDSDPFRDGKITRIAKTTPSIKANIHSDDNSASADFDATVWFEDASDINIRKLAVHGWGAEYYTDDVALYMSKYETQIEPILMQKNQGFECYIDIDSAMAWLDNNRPELAQKFRENPDIETSGTL